MKLKKSIKSNFIFNLICQLIAIIVPLITVPYLSRTLLEEGVGLYSYAESIVSYFVLLAGLGSVSYAQREIGACSENKEKSSRTFWEIFIIRLLTALFSLSIYVVFIVFKHNNDFVYIFLCLNIVNVIFDISWFFWGREEFALVSTINSLSKVLTTVLIFVFVKNQDDVGIYILILSGMMVVANLLSWLMIIGKVAFVSDVKPFRHLKSILVFFIPEIAIQVYAVLDKSMIGWFTESTAENGYYEYAEKIVKIGITVITALSMVIKSRTSKYYAEGDIDKANDLIYKGLSYAWCLSIPITFGLIITADVLVPLYLGEHFAKSAVLIKILAPIVIFIGLSRIVGDGVLIPFRQQKYFLIAIVIASLVNFIINLLLIPAFFSIGAAIGTVCAEFIGIFIQCAFAFKKKMLNIKKFFTLCVKYFISAVVMVIVAEFIKFFLNISALPLFIILVLTSIFVYFLTLLLLKDKFVLSSFKSLLSKLKK